MGSNANRLRKIWQDYGGKKAGKAEKDFLTVLMLYSTEQNTKSENIQKNLAMYMLM